MRLADLIASLGGTLHGDAQRQLNAQAPLAPLDAAGPDQLSFLSHPKYQSQLAHSRAGCVIVAPEAQAAALARGDCIVTPAPYVYFAQVTQWVQRVRLAQAEAAPRIHPSAVVHARACVAEDACIGPLCVVEADAVIGAGTRLTSRVTVGQGCRLGARCLVHPGAVIGADGFGFAPHEGRWLKIEQLGAVVIGDDVEIGANTCIDRGALADTVIEDGVKLDNLVQIGHNVHIGAHSALAGCAGVAGSAQIGAHCTVGGGAVVLGHLSLADGVHVSAASVVTRSLPRAGHYTGFFPLDDNARWEHNAAVVKQLDRLRAQVRTLSQRLDAAAAAAPGR